MLWLEPLAKEAEALPTRPSNTGREILIVHTTQHAGYTPADVHTGADDKCMSACSYIHIQGVGFNWGMRVQDCLVKQVDLPYDSVNTNSMPEPTGSTMSQYMCIQTC